VGVPPRLLLERSNLKGRQLKVEDTSRLAGKRVLVMIGTDDVDHPITVDKPIADWLRTQGARADFSYLGNRAIEGNGHMMMLETNSGRLADVIMGWIAQAR